MKIKFLAHSTFLITSDSGTRIITDPYEVSDAFRHGAIKESADIVTVSHDHHDHNNVAAVRGNPQVFRGAAEAKGISFRAISTAHDNQGGAERGKNIIFCFEVDGIKVCHMGDIGHLLTDNQVVEVGKVQVLFIPVGGFFTVDARTAGEVSEQVRARVIIPMHFKTEKMDFPIKGVEEFLKNKSNVTRVDGSEIEFKPGQLPTGPQIIVLKPSL